MDQKLNLVFSMYNNPGVYALLLGSGVSQSAGIPTGWDIKQDLIDQIGAISDEELPEDTGYDELLEALAKTQAERNSILRQYFEPSEEEQEQSIKMPTRAHEAIARLAKAGYIRVILTTNFDRLMEIALEHEGIIPDVISSDDMLEGATPLRHSPITIIKLHGDYRDVRTLNTAEELQIYGENKNSLLNTIFDEYGLIVCGWSATWDTALRDAISRTQTRRYSTYWVEPYDLSHEGEALVKHRDATVISAPADEFFVDLQDKVEALEKLNREHPLSVAVAVERVKKLVSHDEMSIELEDFVREQSESAHVNFDTIEIPTRQLEDLNAVEDINVQYFARTEIALNILAMVCMYGKNHHAKIISDIIARWTVPFGNNEFEPRNIPSLFLLYVGTIAALHRENWLLLKSVLIEPKIRNQHRPSEKEPVLTEVNKTYLYYYGRDSGFKHKREDPYSVQIRDTIYPVFRKYIPDERDFQETFDLCEMLIALFTIDVNGKLLPHNAIMRSYILSDEAAKHLKEFWINGGKMGKEWGLLQIVFNGNLDRLLNVLETYHQKSQQYKLHSSDTFPDYKQIYTDAGPDFRPETW